MLTNEMEMNTAQSTISKISDGGRIVIPADYREALGVGVGDELVITLDNMVIKIMTRKEARRQAQAFFKSIAPENISLVDELISDRRKEAERE